MSALTWSSFSNLTEQPCLREAPTALSSSGRDAETLGRLLDAEAGKETQLDYLATLKVNLG